VQELDLEGVDGHHEPLGADAARAAVDVLLVDGGVARHEQRVLARVGETEALPVEGSEGGVASRRADTCRCFSVQYKK